VLHDVLPAFWFLPDVMLKLLLKFVVHSMYPEGAWNRLFLYYGHNQVFDLSWSGCINSLMLLLHCFLKKFPVQVPCWILGI
jgi:hypothetical protein